MPFKSFVRFFLPRRMRFTSHRRYASEPCRCFLLGSSFPTNGPAHSSGCGGAPWIPSARARGVGGDLTNLPLGSGHVSPFLFRRHF